MLSVSNVNEVLLYFLLPTAVHTNRLAASAVQGVTGELNDGHEEITEHQAGDMMSLATPVQNVMRGWQQPTGGQRGCQEHRANDKAHGIQGEPDVGCLHYWPESLPTEPF
ncbi:hypothetical protein WN51_03890 [Melipona quadrifasciata]|uniref:Uncharacterized protein n=1 Tax=Melipona quadrifasciata TaxID=166423 RepID=A0A0N0BC28_9HYME|nr:hypothetical protein WN51_03890 [Melipona quadrifasciata]